MWRLFCPSTGGRVRRRADPSAIAHSRSEVFTQNASQTNDVVNSHETHQQHNLTARSAHDPAALCLIYRCTTQTLAVTSGPCLEFVANCGKPQIVGMLAAVVVVEWRGCRKSEL